MHYWRGNDEADSLANKGARKAVELARSGDCDIQLQRAINFYKWVS